MSPTSEPNYHRGGRYQNFVVEEWWRWRFVWNGCNLDVEMENGKLNETNNEKPLEPMKSKPKVDCLSWFPQWNEMDDVETNLILFFNLWLIWYNTSKKHNQKRQKLFDNLKLGYRGNLEHWNSH